MAAAYSVSRLFFSFFPICFLLFLQVSAQNNEEQIETQSYTEAISAIVKALPGKANIDSNPQLHTIFAEMFNESENCRQKGDYVGAMEYDYQALALAEAINLPGEIARAYNNIGISHYRIQSFGKAEKYFLLASSMREYLKDTLRLADTYYNMGMLYDDLGRFDEAWTVYQKSLDLFSAKDVYDGMADVYNGLAGHYYMTGKIDSVTYYASLSLNMFTIMENKDAIAFMQINIGALHNITGQHQKAKKSILEGIETATETNNLNQLRQGYRSLSETYAYMGDYEQAYLHYQIYEQYKDSVFNQEKSAVIEELQTKYETDKAQKELSIKKAQLLELEVDMQKSKNIRNIIVLALIIIVVVTAALWFRYRQNRKTTFILNEKNAELNELNATKDKFFSIVSHDLKSPVSSVARLVSGLEKSLDHLDKNALREYLLELAKTTDNLNDFLKKLLSWALSQKGSLRPVLENLILCKLLNDVVNSSQFEAHPLNILIQLHCDEQLQVCADKSMIETVVRNLLSNAIKFADEGSQIHVNAIPDKGDVKISVSNAGPGIKDEDVNKLFRLDGMAGMIQNHKEKGTGLGLILCNEFVSLHKGNIFLEDNSPENTCFAFTLPGKTMV